MAFNIQAAKQAGYSDQEIQDYLKAQSTYKPNLLNNILSTGGAIAGGALGGAGGAAAGAAIPGVDLTGAPEMIGGYMGGVAGAGAGSGAGNATADFIRSILGDKTVNAQQTINNTPEQMKEGAIGQAVGLPIAKGLAYGVRPIASLAGIVDKTLANSPKSIDIGDLLGKYREDVIPQMQKQGVGSDATQAFNKLSADMAGATSAYKASPNVMDTGGLGMNIPIAQANQLKRDVTKSISNFYGQTTQNADINSRKAFGSLLKNAIQTAEPSVELPNKLASAAYKVPDFMDGLGQILALGNPKAAKALSMIGNVPSTVLHAAIPAHGQKSLLNKGLPAVIQMILGANQTQGNQ